MLKSAELQERLQAILNEATALVNLAKKEDRELTDEEVLSFDALTAESKDIKDKKLPRAKWLEDEQERLSTSDGRQTGLVPTGQIPEGDGFPAPTIVISPRAMLGASHLRAFHGEGAAENAYTAGQFYGAMAGHKNCRVWCDKHDIRADLSTDSAEDGGVLVPVQIERSIIDLVELYATFRNGAENVPMTSDIRTQPRSVSGVTAYYVQENVAGTESQPSFDEVQLIAHKIMTLTPLSNELNDDAIISMGDYITMKIAQAFAAKEDNEGWLGDGSSTYGGTVGMITATTTATATTVTAPTADIAFSDLEIGTFETMIGKLPEFPGINPKWYISKAGWAASMMRLADAAGGNTTSDIEGRRRQLFLGYEVVWVQPMFKTLTDVASQKGVCYFGDLAMSSMFGVRRGVDVKVSEHFFFNQDQLAIRGTERYAINVHDVGDTSNAGPMIMLAFPSS